MIFYKIHVLLQQHAIPAGGHPRFMTDDWGHPFWRAAFPWRKVVLGMPRIPEAAFAAHGPFPCNDCGATPPCPPGRCRAHPALVAAVEARPAEFGGATVREIPLDITYKMRTIDGEECLVAGNPRKHLDRRTFVLLLRWAHEPYLLGGDRSADEDA